MKFLAPRGKRGEARLGTGRHAPRPPWPRGPQRAAVRVLGDGRRARASGPPNADRLPLRPEQEHVFARLTIAPDGTGVLQRILQSVPSD
jgi:hypothetical protein